MRVFLVCLFVLISSCTTRDPEYFVIRTIDSNGKLRNIKTTEHKLEELSDTSTNRDQRLDLRLNEIWQYGLMSSTFPDKAKMGEKQKKAPVHLSGVCGSEIIQSNWSRNVSYSIKSFPPIRQKKIGYQVKGFDYNIWQDNSAKNPKKVVIVFRGTDPQSPGDWYSNLRGITRINPFTWDQYQQTRDLIPPLVEKLKKEYGDGVEIITAGHSLGGGLAQHAAFSSKDIKIAFAFASSPVTGSTSFDKRINTSDVITFSAYEAGEVLSVVRWARRNLVLAPKEAPKVTEVRFNFRSTFTRNREGDGPIIQHGIERFACDLATTVR